MIDVCLHTADAATMRQALIDAHLWDVTADKPITASHQHALDVAGTLYAPDGTTSVVNGVAVANQEALEGYFAQLKVGVDGDLVAAVALLKSLNAYIIHQPATTIREWAGGSYNGPLYWDPDTQELYQESP